MNDDLVANPELRWGLIRLLTSIFPFLHAFWASGRVGKTGDIEEEIEPLLGSGLGFGFGVRRKALATAYRPLDATAADRRAPSAERRHRAEPERDSKDLSRFRQIDLDPDAA
jgi:hypothetical protein